MIIINIILDLDLIRQEQRGHDQVNPNFHNSKISENLTQVCPVCQNYNQFKNIISCRTLWLLLGLLNRVSGMVLMIQ